MVKQQNWAAAIAVQVGPCPLLESVPGAAKTAWFKALAERLDVQYVQCILRQKMPEDAGGVPKEHTFTDIIDGESITGIQYLLGEEMLRAKYQPTLLVLEEINHAGHDTLGAFQEWINERPCYMAAIQNPVEKSTSGVELSPPAINRMVKVPWEIPREAIRQGWTSGFQQYPLPEIPIVPTDFLETNGPYWGELLCKFEEAFPDKFGEEGYPDNPEQACQPWNSYRSFTNMGRLLAACDAVGANQATRMHLMKGCIGDALAIQFNGWLQQQDLPNPEHILANPTSFDVSVRFDIVRAVITSVIACIKAECTPLRWEAGGDVLAHVHATMPEAAATALGVWWKTKPSGYEPRKRVDAIQEMLDDRLAQEAAAAT